MAIKKAKRRNKDPRGFFRQIGVADDMYANLYLRLDILLAKILCSNQRMNTALDIFWQDIFPDFPESKTVYECVKKFYQEYRRTAMDIMQGEDLSDETYRYYMNLQRLITRYAFILDLDKTEFTSFEEGDKIFELLKDLLTSGKTLVKEEVELDIVTYFGESVVYKLSELTLQLLERERDSIQNVYDMLEEIVMKREGKTVTKNIFTSKFNSVKIESLLEACFLDLKEKESQYIGMRNKFEMLFKKHWPEFYPKVELTVQNERMVYNAIKKDIFLSSLRTLILAGNIKDIRSPKIARFIAYGYTLKYVLIDIGICLDLDVICEEVGEMAVKINFVGVDQDEENNIIAALSERYSTASGSIDEEILVYLLNYKDRIGSIYRMMREAYNSRFISRSLEERDKIINELQQRVEYEDINTLKKVVKYFGDRDFGYILNDLYRVCYGQDIFNERRVKDSLDGLFYILKLLGIEPELTDKIDQIFTEADKLNEQCRYDDDIEQNTGIYRLKYPGWKVMEECVLPPICVNAKN